METITDSSASFGDDGIKKRDFIVNCESGEVFMIRNTSNLPEFDLYPTWQAVIIAIAMKIKIKFKSFFRRK